MIKVNLTNWRFWVFSLTVDLLVLAIQPGSILAQVKPNSSQIQATSNSQAVNLAPQILSEINRVRANPPAYAQWLEQQRQYYDGIWLRLPGEKPVRTNRGKKALEEAIATLKKQSPLPLLKTSEETTAIATSELSNFATAKNIQYFSYGRKTAAGIVMDLVVDELFPDRRRRQSLLSPEAEDSAVVCKPDPRYAKVCAIAYSNSLLENSSPTQVAIAQPEVVAPANRPTPVEPKPEAKADESAAKPETEVPSVSPSDQPAVIEETEETVTAEKPPETKTEVSTATLPAPPKIQVPTPPVSTNKPEPEPESQVSQEVEQAEIESEIAAIAEENQEPEPESEPEQEELEAEEPEQEEELVEELEVEEPEQVAISNENISFSEEGALEAGDRVIADDGSLYDFYPIEGKAGDSLTIYLASDDFDAFVALVNSSGKTIGENDDISQEDSNSQIEITLPEDGVYNIIVNTYDEDGEGKYTLEVNQ